MPMDTARAMGTTAAVMARGIMADTHQPITAGRITAVMPRHITVPDIDECTVRPTPTTVDRVTMVDGTTDGIVTTGEVQREELWFDKLDLTATCPPVPFLESPRQP